MINSEKYNDSYSLARLKEGNEHFFNLLFEKYRDRLFTYVYKITKSREQAEETVMDVFLKLWYGREVATEIENLERFLFKVAHNKAIDFLRAAKRNPVLQQEIWTLIENISNENADTQLLQDNIEKVVKTATEQLSPQRQKVFYLRHNEGLSYIEISQRLNLSVNTIRNHLASSSEFIREFLAKNDLMFLVTFLFLQKK